MLMTDSDFPEFAKKLIDRFLKGVATEEEVSQLSAWLKENERHRQYFDEINEAYQTTIMFSSKTGDAWKKLQERIEMPLVSDTTERASQRTRLFSPLRIAAGIGIVAISSYLAITFGLVGTHTAERTTVVAKANRKNTYLLLPDGTKVWLNTNSTLEYPPSFKDDSRLVVLKGEAFFDVQKNGKPFIVKTENMQVLVKGTRFNVQAYKNEAAVKTTLEEGSVELRVSRDNSLYEMKPGDQITLDKHLNHVTMKKVDPSLFTAWKEERLVFDNTPLSSIVAKLENRYRADITMKGAPVMNERFSMTIENESLEEVLEFIRLSSHLQVMKDGNRFIIYQ